MKKHKIALVVAGLILLVGRNSIAAPIQWAVSEGGNGHYYEVIDQSLLWGDAKTYAEGLSSYLVTITSQEEQDFVMNNLSLSGGVYWIGGYQPTGSQEPDGGWTWVTGEAWDYTNWAPGEPNNTAEVEHLLNLWGSEASQYPLGSWNDLGPMGAPFIVEVPELATLSLLAIGGLVMLRRRSAQVLRPFRQAQDRRRSLRV